MSMKCKCGSDDKLELLDGKIIRISDGKEHLCEYNQEHKNRDLQNDQLIEVQTKYHYDTINQIEHTLIKIDSKFATNAPKLDMYIKLIFDNIQHTERKN